MATAVARVRVPIRASVRRASSPPILRNGLSSDECWQSPADPQFAAPAPEQKTQEPGGPDPLSDQGGQGGSLESPPESEDEEWVEDQVDQVEPQGHQQGRPRVLVAPEGAVTGRHEQHGRSGESPDPKVGQGGFPKLRAGSHETDDGHGQQLEQQRRNATHHRRQHQRLHDDVPRSDPVPTAYRTGHQGRSSVREKVEHHERQGEDRCIHAEGGQRDDPEPAHEYGVNHGHQGIRSQGPESREREADDVSIQTGGSRGMHVGLDTRSPWLPTRRVVQRRFHPRS